MIRVIDKCGEDFKKYILELGTLKQIFGYNDFYLFYKLPESVKYILLEDFFDSVGINIEIEYFGTAWSFAIYTGVSSYECLPLKITTRSEARTVATQKANELYNDKN